MVRRSYTVSCYIGKILRWNKRVEKKEGNQGTKKVGKWESGKVGKWESGKVGR